MDTNLKMIQFYPKIYVRKAKFCLKHLNKLKSNIKFYPTIKLILNMMFYLFYFLFWLFKIYNTLNVLSKLRPGTHKMNT